ncbi:hypothetical protein BHM03_00011668 [Ensete ventricosum]|nr:hypothetical protein BHM03_00011668 [Ensete ventricosum]
MTSWVPLSPPRSHYASPSTGLVAGGPLAAAPLQVHRGRLPLAGAPWDATPCELAAADRARGRLLPLRVAAPCGLLPLRVIAPCRGPWLQPVAPLQVAGPSPAAPLPRCFCYENVARTRRTILRDLI